MPRVCGGFARQSSIIRLKHRSVIVLGILVMAATIQAQFRKLLRESATETDAEMMECEAYASNCRRRFAKLFAAMNSMNAEIQTQNLGVLSLEGAAPPRRGFFQTIYSFKAEGWEKVWLTFDFENKNGTDEVTIDYATGRGRRMNRTFNFRQMDQAVPYVLALATAYFGR